MKHAIIILIAHFFFFSPMNTEGQETKATAILDKVAEQTKAYDAVKIIFSYAMDNDEQNIHESYKGEIISQGNKYRLKVAGQEIISSGEKVWTYIPEAQEVQLNRAAENTNRFNPTQLINNYEKRYETTLLNNITKNNRELAVIKLVPITKEQNRFEKAHLVVDKTKDEIYQLIIFGNTGNKFTYTVEELLPGIELPENAFRFSKKEQPEVDIIDMR